MTVERNYAKAIAKLSDWLKNLASVFQPMRSKVKGNRTLCVRFFPRFKKVIGGFQSRARTAILVHKTIANDG